MQLSSAYATPPTDSEGLQDWLRQFVATRRAGPESLERIDEAIAAAIELQHVPLMARTYLERGRICREIAETADAITALRQSQKYGQALNDQHLQAEALIELGRTYNLQAELADALTSYEAALSLLTQDSDIDLIRRIEIGIAHIYILMDEADEAQRVLESALEKARLLQDRTKVATALNNLAYVYLKKKNVLRAREAVTEAIATYDPNAPINFEATLWHTYGETLLECGETERAAEVLMTALEKSRLLNDQNAEALASVDYVRARIALGDCDDAFEDILIHAAEVAEKIQSDRIRLRLRETETMFFEMRGEYDRALKCLKMVRQLEQTTSEFHLRRRLAIWDKRFEQFKEEAKDEQDRFLRELTSSVPGVLFRWARMPSGFEQFLYVSPRCSDLLEISASQLAENARFLVRDADDEQRYQAELASATARHRPIGIECRYRLPSGKVVWIRTDARPTLDENGTVLLQGIMTDVTEQREMRDNLRQTQARFHEAIEAGFDGFILLEPLLSNTGELEDMVITEINRRGSELVSSRRHIPSGVRIRDRLPDDYWQYVAVKFRHVLETGLPYSEEGRLPIRSFAPEWAEFQLFRIGNGVALIIRDATVRHRLNSALKQSEERWQLAIAGTQDGIWDDDLVHRKTYASDQWFRMLGYSEPFPTDAEQFFFDVLHPDDRAVFEDAYRAHVRGDVPLYTAEFRMRSSEGAYRWIMARGKATRDASGRAVRMVGTHTDITESKRIQRLLQSSANASRRLLDDDQVERVMRDIVRDVAKSLEIDRVKIYQASELDPDHPEGSFRPVDPLRMVAEFITDSSLRTETSVISRELFRHFETKLQAGEIVGASLVKAPRKIQTLLARLDIRKVLLVPILSQDQLWGFIVLKDSVSVEWFSQGELDLLKSIAAAIGLALEQESNQSRILVQNERLEHMLKEAERLAEEAKAASRAKSEFVANMSHEIRTPMNGVLGLVDLLIESGLSEKQLRYASGIRHSGDALLTIINDILDFSKIEAGKVSVERIEFVPGMVAREVMGLMEPQALQKGIALEVECGDAVDHAWIGDPVRFRQILTNLIGNAMKFTHEGKVALRCRRVEGNLVATVQDTGIGIAPDRVDRIFESFHQGDNSTTRVYGGTGLGLTITRSLVKLMGGDITVRSKVGEGSSFTVTLPLTYAGPTEPVRVEEAVGTIKGSLTGLHVLVAEDNAINELMLTHILESAGATYRIARDGEEAIQIATSTGTAEFDIILMDVQMPKVDGLSAARAIREHEQTQGYRTPIIAVTAGATQDDLREILEAGMDDRVSKPYRPDKIRKVIRQYVRL
ncbi:MAG: PAS domain-containing protein [Fimbriimonadaceae bacterium]|nr:PAS domain-containing protein [Fimbriimonadaceae bacterium]